MYNKEAKERKSRAESLSLPFVLILCWSLVSSRTTIYVAWTRICHNTDTKTILESPGLVHFGVHVPVSAVLIFRMPTLPRPLSIEESNKI